MLPRSWLIEKSRDYDTLALGLNSAILMFTPHSTFREPLGIVRLATGMVLAVVLEGSRTRRHAGHEPGIVLDCLLVLARPAILTTCRVPTKVQFEPDL